MEKVKELFKKHLEELNNQEITEEIKEEIKIYLETNYNENTTIQSYGMQQKLF